VCSSPTSLHSQKLPWDHWHFLVQILGSASPSAAGTSAGGSTACAGTTAGTNGRTLEALAGAEDEEANSGLGSSPTTEKPRISGHHHRVRYSDHLGHILGHRERCSS